MAGPAQKFEDDKKPGNVDSAPPGRQDLGNLEVSAETSGQQQSWYKGDKKTVDKDELSDLEDKGGEAGQNQGTQHENQIGSGYRSTKKASSKSSSFSSRWRFSRRQTVAGGGVVGTIVALAFGFSVFQGPLEFIHFSQLEQQIHLQSHQDQSDDRLVKLMRFIRYASAGEVERTRLGFLQNKIADSIETKMNATGIESAYSDKFGFGDGYIIDPNKLSATEFEDLKGKSPNEIRQYFKDNFNVDVTTKLPNGKSVPEGTFFLDANTTKLGYFENGKLIKVMVKSAGLTGKTSAVGARIIGKRAGITWHPIESARNSKLSDAERKAAQRKARTQEIEQGATEEITADSKPVDPKHPENANNDTNQARSTLSDGQQANSDLNNGDPQAIDKLKAKLSGKLTTGSLAATGILCIFRGLDQKSDQLKESQVVLPLVREGAEQDALGDQIKSGRDLDTQDLSFYKSLLNGKDHTGKSSSWFEAESIQAQTGHPHSGTPPSKTLTTINDFSPFHFLSTGVQGAALSVACSTAGTGLQIALGFLGGGVESQIVQLAVGQLVGPGLIDEAAHWLAGAAVDPNAAGADHGSAVDFGNLLLANGQAVTEGGRKLTDKESSKILAFENQQSQTEFQGHSLAYRLLNPYDNRTALSRVLDQTSPNIGQNVSHMASALLNVKNIFAFLPNIFSTKAQAFQPAGYNYGIPEYGFSLDELNSPLVKNPYKNAEDVVKTILPAHPDYIQRVKDCFGVTIDPSNYDISSFGADPINPDTPNPDKQNFYSNADPNNCADGSPAWMQVRFYIFDTQSMESIACYEGDSSDPDTQDACSAVGFDEDQSANSADGSTSSPAGTLPKGSAQELAGQLKQYVDNGKIKCVGSNGHDVGCSDIINTAKGTSIRGGEGCEVTALHPELLGMLLELVQMGHTFILSALCSDHHDDGPGGHAGGRAADFNTIDGTFMGPSPTEPWTSAKIAAGKKLDQDIASFMPKSTGFGQIQCHPTFNFLSGFDTFSDLCHHQHIQVED